LAGVPRLSYSSITTQHYGVAGLDELEVGIFLLLFIKKETFTLLCRAWKRPPLTHGLEKFFTFILALKILFEIYYNCLNKKKCII